MDSTQRFSDRVSDYVKYRPSYPDAVIDALVDECDLQQHSVIADIGSGTGKLSALFLQRNIPVIGVEPNKEMREAAVALLSSSDHFSSVAGQSERTGLDENNVDLITAAQAFHWFDQSKTKIEFERILKPGGRLALIWNQRDTEHEFQQHYESLLREKIPEYAHVTHRNIDDESIRSFCHPRQVVKTTYPYSQQFDLPSFIGRMNSSSYTPKSNTSESEALNGAATELFDRFAKQGVVEFTYQTTLYLA